MIVEKAAEKCGVDITGDKMPKDKRTVREFQKLIKAIREAEANLLSNQDERDTRLSVLAETNATLSARVDVLEAELEKCRKKALRDRLDEVVGDRLTIAEKDQVALIEG